MALDSVIYWTVTGSVVAAEPSPASFTAAMRKVYVPGLRAEITLKVVCLPSASVMTAGQDNLPAARLDRDDIGSNWTLVDTWMLSSGALKVDAHLPVVTRVNRHTGWRR
jgi:hypothetical protein